MPGRKSRTAVCALLVALAPRPARAELADVWAVSDGTKVAAGDLDHPLSRGNLVFDRTARRVSVRSARNETVAFQVILEGGREPTRVRFFFEPPAGLGPTAPPSGPERWFVGRRVELFREHYVTIEERSHSLYWEPGSAAEPKLRGRRLPDALIPIESGAEIEVPARQNRAIWIDLYVPKGTAPGASAGRVRIETGGRPCDLAGCRLAVKLDVLDFALPDRPAARTMVWFSGGSTELNQVASRYFSRPSQAPEEELAAVRLRYFQLARRHRLTFFIGQHDHPTEELRRRLSGEAFSPEAGYGGPGEGLGQDLYVLHAYGAKLRPGEAHEWSSWLSRVAPKAEVLYYALDEPGPEQFEEVNRRAREADPIQSFSTARFQPGLDVDVYAALPSAFTRKGARAARAAGKEMWIYNGIRPFSGTFVIDDVAVSPRVNAWIQARAGIGRWFYWEATYYDDFQGGRGQTDVFARADNFHNADGDVGNGDGLLVYPGRDRLFPAHDQGLDRPIPSIRLNNWRRGLQDVEYLALARARGHGAFVDELLESLLPTCLADELEPGDPVPWSESGETWLAARRLVAEAIESGRDPAIPESLRRHYARRRPWRTLLAALAIAFAIVLMVVGARRRRRRRGILSPR